MKALLRKFIVTAVASCAVLYAAGADDNNRSRQAADADTLIVFRFAPGSTAFLRQGNDTALLRATRLVELHRTALEAGQAHLLVKGYCSSFGLPEAGQQAAKTRSNHVKSWFIVRSGLKEEHYLTTNSTHAFEGMEDIVILSGPQYLTAAKPMPQPAGDTENTEATAETTKQPASETIEQMTAQPIGQPLSEATAGADDVPMAMATADAEAHEAAPATPAVQTDAAPQPLPAQSRFTPWSLKTNLLYDALLMPSIEVEYRISRRWSAAIEGNMAWWHNRNKHRYYQLATIVPEGRYWFKPQGERRGHYIGLMAGGGWYDLENGGRGYRGEGIMAGITYGYQFPIGRRCAFEAAIGLGYLHAWHDEYLPIDGHYVYQQSSRLSYFGPVKARLAWVVRL